MTKQKSAVDAVALIPDNAVVAVNSSSGLCCPDLVLQALGERFETEGSPKNLTTIHPIAAGDMFGVKGVDHIAKPGCLTKIIGGSYPSGPSSSDPPLIWQMIASNQVKAYNLPSGIVFDMLREGAGHRPGVLTKVGMDTFVDPEQEGGAMNESAVAEPIVKRMEFEGDDWLYFAALRPDVAIIRATTGDERGNLGFKSEGAYLGAMEMALAAHNCGGTVIAQVRQVTQSGSLRPHDVHVPGILVDALVEAPDMLQTTATTYDPAISGAVPAARSWAREQLAATSLPGHAARRQGFPCTCHRNEARQGSIKSHPASKREAPWIIACWTRMPSRPKKSTCGRPSASTLT